MTPLIIVSVLSVLAGLALAFACGYLFAQQRSAQALLDGKTILDQADAEAHARADAAKAELRASTAQLASGDNLAQLLEHAPPGAPPRPPR